MSSLEAYIRTLAPGALQINLWPTKRGYQANVKDTSTDGWTCCTEADPIDAVREALRQRACCRDHRSVGPAVEPEQVDIEEAIAAAAPATDIADLLG